MDNGPQKKREMVVGTLNILQHNWYNYNSYFKVNNYHGDEANKLTVHGVNES